MTPVTRATRARPVTGNLEPVGKRAVGELVAVALRKAGFKVDWNGDPDNRVHLPRIDWKRRRRTGTACSQLGAFINESQGNALPAKTRICSEQTVKKTSPPWYVKMALRLNDING